MLRHLRQTSALFNGRLRLFQSSSKHPTKKRHNLNWAIVQRVNRGARSRLRSGTNGYIFTYGYESDSNLLARLSAPQHTAAYTYETNRDLMTIIDNQASRAFPSQYTYTHDGLGRRTNRAQSGSATNTTITDVFGYNGYSEVISSLHLLVELA